MLASQQQHQQMLGGLSEEEWREIAVLDYILTWRYTDDMDRDEKDTKN